MKIRRLASLGLIFAASMTTALSSIVAADAHVVAEPQTVEAGQGATIAFRVGHGCGDSPTTSIRMQIPEGVVGVTVKALPGWEIETVTGPITPYENHGATISEGVTQIAWRGGPLPDGVFELFTIRATIPDTPGETLYFPVVQECAAGENAWIEIPADGESGDDLEFPAPAIQVIAATGDSEGHSGGSSAASAEDNGEANATPDAVVGSISPGEDDSKTLSWIALGVGVLGLVVGAGGLATGLRTR